MAKDLKQLNLLDQIILEFLSINDQEALTLNKYIAIASNNQESGVHFLVKDNEAPDVCNIKNWLMPNIITPLDINQVPTYLKSLQDFMDKSSCVVNRLKEIEVTANLKMPCFKSVFSSYFIDIKNNLDVNQEEFNAAYMELSLLRAETKQLLEFNDKGQVLNKQLEIILNNQELEEAPRSFLQD
jgi:hypothetical protein